MTYAIVIDPYTGTFTATGELELSVTRRPCLLTQADVDLPRGFIHAQPRESNRPNVRPDTLIASFEDYHGTDISDDLTTTPLQ